MLAVHSRCGGGQERGNARRVPHEHVSRARAQNVAPRVRRTRLSGSYEAGHDCHSRRDATSEASISAWLAPDADVPEYLAALRRAIITLEATTCKA